MRVKKGDDRRSEQKGERGRKAGSPGRTSALQPEPRAGTSCLSYAPVARMIVGIPLKFARDGILLPRDRNPKKSTAVAAGGLSGGIRRGRPGQAPSSLVPDPALLQPRLAPAPGLAGSGAAYGGPHKDAAARSTGREGTRGRRRVCAGRRGRPSPWPSLKINGGSPRTWVGNFRRSRLGIPSPRPLARVEDRELRGCGPGQAVPAAGMART